MHLSSSPPPLAQVLRRICLTTGIAYLILLGLLAGCQRKLIYLPGRADESTLRSRAQSSGWLPWEDASGKLIGWRSGAALSDEPPSHRLVIFHGNAGQALDRRYLRDGFREVNAGTTWEVFAFEYPGYGAKSGFPSERAFTLAASAALADLLKQDDRPLVLLGESLGSGVASAMAGQYPDQITGLILVTPFTRLSDVVAHHYPLFPVRHLLRDHYDNVAALHSYTGPVALRLAGNDEVIPVRLGQELWESYPGTKRLWVEEGAGHNDMDYSVGHDWWNEVTDFLITSH